MSEGLWELLTRRRVNKEHVTSDDLRTYKKILLLTNAHLDGYQPGGVINVSRGKKFREIIALLFARPKSLCVESGIRRAWKNTNMSAKALYYDLAKPSAFSTVNKLSAVLSRKTSLMSERSWTSRKFTLCKSLSGSDSCAIPILCQTTWTCGNATYWMYSPSQNTMISTDTFYL